MPRDSHSRRLLIAIFLIAIVWATWQGLNIPGAGLGRFWEAPAIARNLAAGRGFSSPYGALDTGPTAHLAPLFPALLAVLLRALGDTPNFAFAAFLLAVLAHAFYCVLLVPLSTRILGDPRPGFVAAIFSALVPTIQVLPQWEAIYAAVGLQVFCLATAQRVSPGIAAGALCGVLLLLNPALLPVAIVWMLYRGMTPRQWLGFTLGVALALTPWTIRNYRVMGGLFYVRDNLGSELHMSNADCSAARDGDNQVNGCHALLQPNRSITEATAVRDMGEYAFNRSRMAEARRWIAEHPGEFLRLTGRRMVEFWFPTPENWPIYEYSRWIITVLSAVGLGILIREKSRAALFFGGAMLLYPLLYYTIQASSRYRTPVLWISLLPAAYAVTRARIRRI